jgi:hypothetical protein
VPDVIGVPLPFVLALADQLLIEDPMSLLADYAHAAVRWRHTGRSVSAYGYHSFTTVV